MLYLSGQIGAADDERPVVPGGMPAEARRMMELIGDLFKCTAMLADMNDWPAFNEIYARVEMECWADAAGRRAP